MLQRDVLHLRCGGPRTSAKQLGATPLAPRRRNLRVESYYRRSPATIAHPETQQQRQAGAAPGTNVNSRGAKHYHIKKVKHVMPSTRSVKFHVRYKCDFGQEVYLVGNCSALGNWDVLEGVQLVWSPGHIWEGSVELPAGMHIQYKYVVRNRDGSVVRWQEGANVSLELPGGPAEALAVDVEDSWNKDKQVKRILASGTPVRFNIRLKVEFGQQLFVVGSCATLGGWNVDNAVRLNWQQGHIWEASVELPAGEMVAYKYVIKLTDGSVERWQPGDNMQMEVPVAQGNNGRRRGVLVLDTWARAAAKAAAKARSFGSKAPGASWRSTPYTSVPAGAAGVSVHTDSPQFGSPDIDSSASAVAARSFYSMMDHQGQPLQSSSSSLAGSAEHIRDPTPQQHDPSLVQLWTDKPRFAASQQPQSHHDPWRAAQQQQQHDQPPHEVPRVLVPQPAAGASSEEFARWQALNSVMSALQHSSELDHWVDDPTDPRMLAADRRLAALTASLGTSNIAAMV